jgi:ribosomal protein S24E
MKTKIAKEKYNQFLKRKELIVSIENPEEPTPAKDALQQLLAKEMNIEIEHIEILDIQPKRGIPMSTARIFVWDEKKIQKKEESKEEKAADSGTKKGKAAAAGQPAKEKGE